MSSIFFAAGILLFSGLCALFFNEKAKAANFIGSFGAVIACIVGLVPVVRILFSGNPESISFAWPFPYGSISLVVDSLSALFLFPLFVLSAITALYGCEYLAPADDHRSTGGSWLFFNILVVSMVVVVIARNVLLFLLAWEVMTLSSYLLVTLEGEKESVRRAGLIYLIATHIGTAFLFVMFILLGAGSGSFDFARFVIEPGRLPSIIFLLAIIGFGTKAGFIPFHIWLPEAHPAAPSHVSALMSGIMIKMGIYGIIRVLTFLGVPPLWWGWLLIIIGISSGVLGVVFALAQHDLKRLLAYSSIENIGIITIGLGIGVFGLSINSPVLVVLGFSGGLLHVINHAFFKGLLFLGAGAVLHVTQTRDIDVLGGLLKKMPWTGFTFLIGAAAISGLPPLNGFISEFLIYLGAFKGTMLSNSVTVAGLVVIAALALIGGLAVACFTKAFGIVFLGQARSAHCAEAHEVGWKMKAAMVFLAAACIAIGLSAPAVLSTFNYVIADIAGGNLLLNADVLPKAITPLTAIVRISFCFLFFLLFMALLRWQILRKREVGNGRTWDCGYAGPTSRMQYTASSFVQPLTDFLMGILRTQKNRPVISDYFPKDAFFVTETPDIFNKKIYRPFLEGIHGLASKLHWFQHGRLQPYILYIFISLLILIVWKLW